MRPQRGSATTTNRLRWIVPCALAFLLAAGCGPRAQSDKATAAQLQKSFEKAGADTTAEVAQVSSALQRSNYTEAIAVMSRVVQTQPINEAQKQAVDALILHTRQAVQQNPKLNSPQLYQATSDLMVRVHGEN